MLKVLFFLMKKKVIASLCNAKSTTRKKDVLPTIIL